MIDTLTFESVRLSILNLPVATTSPRAEWLIDLTAKHAGRHGNTINYVVGMVEALQQADSEEELTMMRGSIQTDIETAIVEKVKADVVGMHTYEAQWDPSQGMMFGGRRARDFYQNAIDNPQIPLFEKARNLANLRNLASMEWLKANGEKGIFIEISPSPELTPEAKARGYDGRDSIFFYDLSAEDRIKVTQHWFKSDDLQQYPQLISSLRDSATSPAELEVGEDLEQFKALPDAQIMARYLYLRNADLLGKVEGFIHARQNATNLEAIRTLASLSERINGDIASFLPQLEQYAAQLIEDHDLDMSQLLGELADNITQMQFNLRYELLSRNNLNTFAPEVYEKIRQNPKTINLRELRMISGFTALGCGFQIGDSATSLSTIMPKINAPRTCKIFDADDPVVCPSCKEVFYVKNGDSDTYYSRCPYCGSDKVSCG